MFLFARAAGDPEDGHVGHDPRGLARCRLEVWPRVDEAPRGYEGLLRGVGATRARCAGWKGLAPEPSDGPSGAPRAGRRVHGAGRGFARRRRARHARNPRLPQCRLLRASRLCRGRRGHLGFAVVDEDTCPIGGYHTWSMLREACGGGVGFRNQGNDPNQNPTFPPGTATGPFVGMSSPASSLEIRSNY